MATPPSESSGDLEGLSSKIDSLSIPVGASWGGTAASTGEVGLGEEVRSPEMGVGGSDIVMPLISGISSIDIGSSGLVLAAAQTWSQEEIYSVTRAFRASAIASPSSLERLEFGVGVKRD